MGHEAPALDMRALVVPDRRRGGEGGGENSKGRKRGREEERVKVE
jgi:hypothetical protein